MAFDFDNFKKGNNVISYLGLIIIILALLIYPIFSTYNNVLLVFPIPIYIGGIIWKVFFYKNSIKKSVDYRKFTNIFLILSGLAFYSVINLLFNIGLGTFVSTSGSSTNFINDTSAQVLKIIVIILFITDLYIIYYLLYKIPSQEAVISKKKLRRMNKYLSGFEDGTKVSLEQIAQELDLTKTAVKKYLGAILRVDKNVGQLVENESAFIKLSNIGSAINLLLEKYKAPQQEKEQESTS